MVVPFVLVEVVSEVDEFVEPVEFEPEDELLLLLLELLSVVLPLTGGIVTSMVIVRVSESSEPSLRRVSEPIRADEAGIRRVHKAAIGQHNNAAILRSAGDSYGQRIALWILQTGLNATGRHTQRLNIVGSECQIAY